jgi:hypothetical protein
MPVHLWNAEFEEVSETTGCILQGPGTGEVPVAGAVTEQLWYGEVLFESDGFHLVSWYCPEEREIGCRRGHPMVIVRSRIPPGLHELVMTGATKQRKVAGSTLVQPKGLDPAAIT